MKVLILGASGGVGVHLVKLAAEAGHEVTALSRQPITAPAGVRVIVDDVARPGALIEATRGQAAVLSSLGIRRKNQANPFSPLASPADFTSSTAQQLVTAMKTNGVSRVIAVSASGIGDSEPGLNLMMRVFIRWTNVGANYRDLARMEQIYASSGLDWLCVRPVGLTDKPKSGPVKQVPSFAFNSWISRAEVARWMVERLADPTFSDRTPTIAEVP
ncbi:MAG: NAD(P)H-binding protein [Archangium sp.]|nr:NAD(P)H-binding protein [Archangium sp.]